MHRNSSKAFNQLFNILQYSRWPIFCSWSGLENCLKKFALLESPPHANTRTPFAGVVLTCIWASHALNHVRTTSVRRGRQSCRKQNSHAVHIKHEASFRGHRTGTKIRGWAHGKKRAEAGTSKCPCHLPRTANQLSCFQLIALLLAVHLLQQCAIICGGNN